MSTQKAQRILSLLAFVFTSVVLRAQVVFIPDTNLRAWFNTTAPGCVDASGWFDPTHPMIQADTSFAVYITWPNSDLSGLEALPNARFLSIVWMEPGPLPLGYPDSVRTLYLNSADTTALPPMPPLLERLWLTECDQLTSLPTLPTTLHEMELRGSQMLSALPPLPAGLRTLYMEGVGLTSMDPWPAALGSLTIKGGVNTPSIPDCPPQLQRLELGNVGLTGLPALNNALEELLVYQLDQLGSIPPLPDSLQLLSLNALPSLIGYPAWPAALEDLSISSMDLTDPLPPFPSNLGSFTLDNMWWVTGLPMLPQGLHSLMVRQCHSFTDLPALPSSLRFLHVKYCDVFTDLPSLPEAVEELSLLDDPLFSCLPWLHDSLTVNVSGTQVSCIPNKPLTDFGIAPLVLAEQLCGIYGPECLSPSIIGSVYVDLDSDGVRDIDEQAYGGALIMILPDEALASSDNGGTFRIAAPPGSYTLTPSIASPYINTIQPAQHTAMITVSTPQDSLNDFGISVSAVVPDIEVDLQVSRSRPGFPATAWITARNIGFMNAEVELWLDLDTVQDFQSSTPAATLVNGNTCMWDLGILLPGEQRVVTCTLYTPVTRPLGTPFIHVVHSTPLSNDPNPANDLHVFSGMVVGSADPNAKTVYPPVLSPAELMAGSRVEYVIQFQNTGNYPAERVVITDTLPPGLEYESIAFQGSSHACSWQVSNGVLRITYDPIWLPDSTSNEPGSHGAFWFTIDPVDTLPLGTVLNNVANIYFDFNEPVITEPAVLLVDESNHTSDLSMAEAMVFPSPAMDVLHVRADGPSRAVQWRLLDMAGRLHGQGNDRYPAFDIPLTTLAAGCYLLELDHGDGRSALGFMKQ